MTWPTLTLTIIGRFLSRYIADNDKEQHYKVMTTLKETIKDHLYKNLFFSLIITPRYISACALYQAYIEARNSDSSCSFVWCRHSIE